MSRGENRAQNRGESWGDRRVEIISERRERATELRSGREKPAFLDALPIEHRCFEQNINVSLSNLEIYFFGQLSQHQTPRSYPSLKPHHSEVK
jgi:hypothetical protein